MDKDIKESREYRLAKDWEMAVNNYSFNPARFAAAIPTMHPTLVFGINNLSQIIYILRQAVVIKYKVLRSSNSSDISFVK